MNKYHIKIGDQTYQSVFIGNEEIAKIFLGDTLIWEKYLKLMLTLDPNGGQLVNNDPLYELTCGFEFPVVINDPSRIGYTFLEWNSRKDGSGNTLILKGIVPFEDDLTAYAKWILNSYSINVVASPSEGGTASSSKSVANYGENVNLIASNKTGYHFNKWSDKNENTNRTITIANNVNLTAYFNKNLYAITYDMSGHGTNPSSNPLTALYKEVITPIAPDDVADWNFLYWEPTSTEITSNTTFTAHWIESICTVTYVVNCFGITPNIITTIKETGEVITETTLLGINTLIFLTHTNKNATISTNAPENAIIMFIKPDGTVLKLREYSYITDNITLNFRMLLINTSYDFAYIAEKIHEERFILTSGSLIGGFKYKFHYHINGLTADEGWGKISVGHMGILTDHIMYLSFGYQVEGQAITKVEFEYNADNASKIVGGKKTGKVIDLQVTNLNRASTYIQIKDFIIDLTGYSVNTNVNIGIILRDYNTDCSGIYFGISGMTTTCTLEIVE